MSEVEEVTEQYPLFECSEKAKTFCVANAQAALSTDEAAHNAKYPFAKMNIGQAFAIPFAALNVGTVASLRNRVSQYYKQTGKRFKVITHKEINFVEVVRIA